ncbi:MULTISPECIES: YidH family protein [Sphingomonas]|uniref:DUF202 domain-containing protein n=1 Tax=Edaphosphingomonas fennica TaxID=114404 RepID=A0A2T4HRV0_9SPHN|nr:MULTISPECIES: DUF202 domain-containing protein [Sphingomonas]AGH50302.1 hypothetical protein G432_12915 [Sphingomonas sp. MM-1]MDX3885348.1 DUF202 domain-containing protein [Sphingomonas sp.]PTD18516.1 DUF202 domain-containing protein [Sphingomonas fennica]
MDEPPVPPGDADSLIGGDPSEELSSNRTALSLFRTEMSSDRTLMSVVRTSLSLIAFGFTVFQFFQTLKENYLKDQMMSAAPRRFGAVLIAIGMVMLCLGLYNHVRSIRMLRERRNRLYRLGLIHNMAQFQLSSTTLIAGALLIVGLFAILRAIFHIGPF